MSEERGPSYWDCAQAIEEIRKRRTHSIEVRLMPPMPRLDGRGWSTWIVGLHLRPMADLDGRECHVQASWGKGGACATMPAALYRCVLHALEQLDQAQRSAEQRAMF